MTSLTIDARTTDTVISPLLFGHNFEVTRRAVWSGIGAEMVANRKFAATENGLPKRWSVPQHCGCAVLDDRVAFVGSHSIRLGEDGIGGLGQRQESLAFSKDIEYVFRFQMRSVADRTIRIAIVGSNGDQPVLRTEMNLEPGDWQTLEGRFSSPITAENACLEVTSNSLGVFWIGAASLQRADAFHGMRRDVIDLLKRIKPGCLRYPGGCYAEFYRWKDGLLPVDKRPSIGPVPLDFLLPNSDNYDTHEIGIDEFMALCREVGCQPAITARLCETTPDDAAAWVEHCNSGPESTWGGQRARRGHHEPYNVKYWFVGNELYSFGRGLASGAGGCASQSRLFAEAMKAADPSIRLVVCTNFAPFLDTPKWNDALLPACRGVADCCSFHDYVLGHVQLKTNEDMGNVARAPTENILGLLQSARSAINEIVGKDKSTGITFDEWNTYWGRTGSVAMGLYVGGFLNMLCRESGDLGIEMANFFQPITEGAIAVTPLSAELDTAGLVFELFAPHQGNTLLNLGTQPVDGDIDACASIDADGSRVCVTMVNRSVNVDHVVELDLKNAGKLIKSSVTFLVARDVTIEQAILDTHAEALEVTGGHTITRVPRYSIARVDLVFG